MLDFVTDFFPSDSQADAADLQAAWDQGFMSSDSYGSGDVVQKLEAEFAKLLGKEDSILLPTGTMANHLALRCLAPQRNAVVLAQADSHLARDCGDAPTGLSGFSTRTFVDDHAGLTADAIHQHQQTLRSGKVPQLLNVVSMESPMRRRFGVGISPERRAASIQAARDVGAKLHLDGARLLFEAASLQTSAAKLAAPFDTVYVSLWKTLGTGYGAILAGDSETLNTARDDRRRLGGSLASFANLAGLSLVRMQNIETNMAEVNAKANALSTELQQHGVALCLPEHGSHIRVLTEDRKSGTSNLVLLPAWESSLGGYPLRMNRSLLSQPVQNVARLLIENLKT